MKARILTAALACVVVVPPAPAAATLTKSQLYGACQASRESSAYTYCRDYIAGYFDGFRVSAQPGSPNEFCPSPGLTTERIWKKLAPSLKPPREQSEDELVPIVLAEALIGAYRCKKGNRNSNKRADPRSRSELYAACQAPKKSSSHTSCRGYLSGHFEGFSMGLDGVMPDPFCPDVDLSAEQIWAKVEPSLKRGQGQGGDEAAETALAEALLSAYPCEKPK